MIIVKSLLIQYSPSMKSISRKGILTPFIKKIRLNLVIDYLNKYSTIKIDKKAKVKYLDYNWNLNK